MEYLKELKSNPVNPRKITKENLNKLKKSILTFPEMLEKRPIVYDEDGIILGGNMRFQAIKELVNENKFEIKDTYFSSTQDWTEEQKRAFAIKDNIELGDWDFDILANEWSGLPLEDWGFNTIGIFGEEDAEVDRLDELKEKKQIKCPNCFYEFHN